ncbi:hypothetical protein S40285_04295 [Stachybotrys chlorohalonatus IBT 40285]|uniref:Uncharacterized protein n=1 Tax=Stachybotrys chlorohalonatus (strain IBT 40285) TaxID=1283841 RepID=A0A084QQ59_STAC4|nr:hypothetical protein S40285_04295 [Stachybotrys chlorohalonata IBT 40285]
MESIRNLDYLHEPALHGAIAVESIDDLRLKALKLCLEDQTCHSKEAPDIDDVVKESLATIRIITSTKRVSNELLIGLSRMSTSMDRDPAQVVEDAIIDWYMSTFSLIPGSISCRENEGYDDNESDENEVDDDSDTSSDSDEEVNAPPNIMGLVAALLTSEPWMPPHHPVLRRATLISNVVVTVLFAAHLILHKQLPSTKGDNETRPKNCQDALKHFLRFVWKLEPKTDCIPLPLFGASPDEIKLQSNGRGLLINTPSQGWVDMPEWHPCRKVPGSAWNKFMRNHLQPIFSTASTSSEELFLEFHLNSVALEILAPYETYYDALEVKFDERHTQRGLALDDDAEDRQYATIAAATGHEYPDENLDETNADVFHIFDHDYLGCPSMLRKPMTDQSGHLIFAFLSTSMREINDEEEFEDLDDDGFALHFKRGLVL